VEVAQQLRERLGCNGLERSFFNGGFQAADSHDVNVAAMLAAFTPQCAWSRRSGSTTSRQWPAA
jgi:hypothetical protein